MKKAVLWLSHHPTIAIIITAVYYIQTVLLHEKVGELSGQLDKLLSRETYNWIITGIATTAILIYTALILFRLFDDGFKRKKLFYFIATLIFCTVAFELLLVIKVETIHFLQYFVLGVLLFVLIRRFGETVGWATLFGAMDELYQYIILNPDRLHLNRPPKSYYDFNDVVLNLLGAALAILLLYCRHHKLGYPSRRPFFSAPVWWVYGAILLTGVSLYFSGILHLYPSPDSNAALLLSKIPPTEGFWTTKHPNVTFHILQPLEGLLVVLFLVGFYASLDNRKASAPP